MTGGILSYIPARVGDTTGDRLLSPLGNSDAVQHTKRQQNECVKAQKSCFIRMLHDGCWIGCELIAVEIYWRLLESQEHNERELL